MVTRLVNAKRVIIFIYFYVLIQYIRAVFTTLQEARSDLNHIPLLSILTVCNIYKLDKRVREGKAVEWVSSL